MTLNWIRSFKRNETYLVSVLIGCVFVAAMGAVAWFIGGSTLDPPYEEVSSKALESVFATGYLRFREDDGSPYLKVEVHNGTLWWIKKLEFEFEGTDYSLRDPDAFRPLHFGALRCILKKTPPRRSEIEYDLKIVRAFGYPPVDKNWKQKSKKIAVDGSSSLGRN
jgi:hypothetical protein